MISKFEDGEEEYQINLEDDSLEDQKHHFDKEIMDAKKRRKTNKSLWKEDYVRAESRIDSNSARTQSHQQRYRQFSESKLFNNGISVFGASADINFVIYTN